MGAGAGGEQGEEIQGTVPGPGTAGHSGASAAGASPGHKWSRIRRWLPPVLPMVWTHPPGTRHSQGWPHLPRFLTETKCECFTGLLSSGYCPCPAGVGCGGCRGRVRTPLGFLGAVGAGRGGARCEEAAGREAGAKHVEGRALLPIKLQTVSQEIAFLTWSLFVLFCFFLRHLDFYFIFMCAFCCFL